MLNKAIKTNFWTKKLNLDKIGFFKTIISFLFILSFLIFTITTESESGTLFSYAKYAVLLLSILVSSAFVYFHRKELNSRKVNKEYFYLAFVVVLFLIFSLFKTIITSKLTVRIIMEFFFLISPILYSYLIVRIFTIKQIYYLSIVTFFICFFGYLFTLNMNISEIFNNFLSANFFNSTSKLESHTFAGVSISFCLFFIYYNKNKLITILSILFVLFTFKRLAVLFAFFFLFCTLLRRYIDKKPSKAILNTIIILTVCFLLIYYVLMQPSIVEYLQINFGIDLRKFTMTRTDRLKMLLNSNYISYGFGSSTEFMYSNFDNVSLEMDMIKIIIELGFIPAIAFIFGYFKFASKNYFSLLIISFCILNLITSSSLTSVFSWIISYITIVEINHNRKSSLYEI